MVKILALETRDSRRDVHPPPFMLFERLLTPYEAKISEAGKCEETSYRNPKKAVGSRLNWVGNLVKNKNVLISFRPQEIKRIMPIHIFNPASAKRPRGTWGLRARTALI